MKNFLRELHLILSQNAGASREYYRREDELNKFYNHSVFCLLSLYKDADPADKNKMIDFARSIVSGQEPVVTALQEYPDFESLISTGKSVPHYFLMFLFKIRKVNKAINYLKKHGIAFDKLIPLFDVLRQIAQNEPQSITHKQVTAIDGLLAKTLKRIREENFDAYMESLSEKQKEEKSKLSPKAVPLSSKYDNLYKYFAAFKIEFDKAMKLVVEKKLIEYYNPEMNTQAERLFNLAMRVGISQLFYNRLVSFEKEIKENEEFSYDANVEHLDKYYLDLLSGVLDKVIKKKDHDFRLDKPTVNLILLFLKRSEIAFLSSEEAEMIKSQYNFVICKTDKNMVGDTDLAIVAKNMAIETGVYLLEKLETFLTGKNI